MAEAYDWQSIFTEQTRQQELFYFRLAMRILGDAAAAEDACQRAFLRTWQRRGEINRVEAIRGYLARSVVNESLQLRRRRATERRALDGLARSASSGAGGPIGASSAGREPCAGLEQREWVWQALNQLHEPTRTVVVLRVMHGLTGQEVSRQLGCSASEVSRRMHDGLETLREAVRLEHAAVSPR